jgi:hypothetical protein
MINRNSGVFYELKALFLHLACNKGNPDLQLVNIDGTFSSSDGGANANQIVLAGAATLYCIYLKKFGTVLTVFKASDSATTAVTATPTDIDLNVTTAAEEILLTYPTGHALTAGLTITENTTAAGSTLTLKANRLDGFAIFSA